VSAAEVVEPEAFRQVREAQQSTPAAVFLEATGDRDELLRRVNVALKLPEGLRVVAVVERGTDDEAEYDLHLEDERKIEGGRRSAVADPRKFELALTAKLKADAPELPYYIGALLAERVPISLEVAERLRSALEALVAADASWSREVAAHRGLASLAGRDELAAELPRRSDEQRQALAQWDSLLRDDPGALVPVPRSLLPGPDDEA